MHMFFIQPAYALILINLYRFVLESNKIRDDFSIQNFLPGKDKDACSLQ